MFIMQRTSGLRRDGRIGLNIVGDSSDADYSVSNRTISEAGEEPCYVVEIR